MIYLNTDKDPLNQAHIPIHSDAYAEGIPNFVTKHPNNYVSMLSSAHKIIYQTKHQCIADEVFYAKINESYIDELVLLHREWFPTYYDKEYFKKFLVKQNYIAIGAFVKIMGNDYLIASCLGEIVSENKFRENVADVLYEKSFFDWFSPNELCGYLNTFGVIDEYRRLGIGTKLMEKYINEMKNRNCVALYLHVIEHNNSAIKFYEKMKWSHAGVKKNYYYYDNSFYDGVIFYYVLMENVAFQTVQIDNNASTQSQTNVDFTKKGCFQRICCCCRRKRSSYGTINKV